MELERSERLLQHLPQIREMVDYLEVSGTLLTSGIISSTDHRTFLGVVSSAGNSSGIQELVQVLRLRRNGFTAFVSALRANDYTWLAEKLDPEPFTTTKAEEPPTRRRISGLLKRSRSRNSESSRLSGETVFTTYRQSFPMDLSASSRSLNQCHTTLTKSFDSLNLQGDRESMASSSSSSKRKNSIASALLLNVPAEASSLPDAEIVSKIAAEFNFFSLPESLASLKRINIASKSPQSKKKLKKKEKLAAAHLTGGCKSVNLKIKFKTKDARDRFVAGVNSSSIFSDLGGIKGVPLDSKKGDKANSTTTTGGSWFSKLLKR
ncbi:uncharacterized protein LOC110845044 [Folsomia candida]|uniref:Uncharacterized protein n=1 Tax=Folsomia candida TaxID=158441 RepID=A0A226ETI5_FOLCA|nr:uncharacterized protein LOC110845044 [Folsomia candida]OXA60923.1 hypothetical protein Fcan01_04439 [Folsomia candida]